MNDTTGLSVIPVRTGGSLLDSPSALDVPSRSRLYGLLPCKVGTIWTESLTSYINRLGWAHRVSPRGLVVQELLPHVSGKYPAYPFATFCRQGQAMSTNGTGNLAQEWSAALEKLTGRFDLHLLTFYGWAGDFLEQGHLRQTPAWCPVCYAEWREQKLPLYQPLLWMLQMVTVCWRHKRWLEERCPHCQKHQSIITLETGSGYCTQCKINLSSSPDTVLDRELDIEELRWQEWVIHTLEELRLQWATTGVLSWEPFFANLARCMEKRGICSKLADLTGFSREVFYLWIGRKQRDFRHTPSLETLFEFCYACNITPLQVIETPDILLQAAQKEPVPRRARASRFTRSRVNREDCLKFIHAVLDGREEPLGMYQIAKRLGHPERVLFYHFPKECEQIKRQAQAYRKQRKEQRVVRICEEIRQTVVTLHAQGVFPSYGRVKAALSDPNLMRMPEARDTWRAIRRELGIERK
jgi:hypothetical protein